MLNIPSPMDSILRPSFARPGFAGTVPPKGPRVDLLRPAGLGATFDTMMELPGWAGDLLRFLGHGGMGFVGIYMGADKTGFISTIGWIVGIMSAFAALLDVCSLIGRMGGKE